MDGPRVLMLLACLVFCSVRADDGTERTECSGWNKIKCQNGTCVTGQRCDDIPHCTDYSDEKNCPIPDSYKPQLKQGSCQDSQLSCKDQSRCINISSLCDDIHDCKDSSDERNCTFVPVIGQSKMCKGFTCKNGKCISRLWMCDGKYDCDDKSDENEFTCNVSRRIEMKRKDPKVCREFTFKSLSRNFKCLDASFCVNQIMMCDGMLDCRDGSDEGPFCDDFHTMCLNYTCKDKATCFPTRDGPTCECVHKLNDEFNDIYNYNSHKCERSNGCNNRFASCSHFCVPHGDYVNCTCDVGYLPHKFKHSCLAPPPEGKIYFTTNDEIRYVTLKTKKEGVLAKNLKKVHGIATDGNYLYWTEAADGHQVVVRAEEDAVDETKQILVSIGLEKPGDIAADWMGGHIYFTDTKKGCICVCRIDGSICKTLEVSAKRPLFISLDPRNGKMYWSDWSGKSVIEMSNMDGTGYKRIVDDMESMATALAIDAANGRLYFIDSTIKVVVLETMNVYTLLENVKMHPYSVAVFENMVYWSDWIMNAIYVSEKFSELKDNIHYLADESIFDIEVYHPVMRNRWNNPCENHTCTHFCLVTSNVTYTCACPDDMHIDSKNTCVKGNVYRSDYVIVGGDDSITRIPYNTFGNFENHATQFDIGRVQAMAFDNFRDHLHIYDGQRKIISFVKMDEFTLGKTEMLINTGLVNVVDMDYDYVSDCLYILDAGRRLVEVVSLRNRNRALLYNFVQGEIPISMCVVPEYGKLLIAFGAGEQYRQFAIMDMGLDGQNATVLLMDNLKGPHVSVRYLQETKKVYFSDQSNNTINVMNPDGTDRQMYRESSTGITNIVVTKWLIFWVGRRGNRIYWADIDGYSQEYRRAQLSAFSNNTQLHLQVTAQFPNMYNPMLKHPCYMNHNLCSHLCVQSIHPVPRRVTSANVTMGYKCLCHPGMELQNGKCFNVQQCKDNEVNCYKSNVCILQTKVCNGKKDCLFGEDEEDCPYTEEDTSKTRTEPTDIEEEGEKEETTTIRMHVPVQCSEMEFRCVIEDKCIARAQVCDRNRNCQMKMDERVCATWTCREDEFRCGSDNCIPNTWRCDGEKDCANGYDEFDCMNTTCGQDRYHCHNGVCIEMKKRCDGKQDCFDNSDELQCDEVFVLPDEDVPQCAEQEFTCELNKSICLPFTARCNRRNDCPGGTDEYGCPHCGKDKFACVHSSDCWNMSKVCDGVQDCSDGSDESPDACASVGKTSVLFPKNVDCGDGWMCKNQDCIPWDSYCNFKRDCKDGSDEVAQCWTNRTECEARKICEHFCKWSPTGPHCTCLFGFHRNGHSCWNIDECDEEMCPQTCGDQFGEHFCNCRDGYALTAARSGCKSIKKTEPVVFVYLSGGKVRTLTARSEKNITFQYLQNSYSNAPPVDIGYDFRRNRLYVTDKIKLFNIFKNSSIEFNSTVVSNVGQPTKIAVDWVTGNVYFVDSTPTDLCIRVCNFETQKCAKLQKLPPRGKVTAFIVDPNARLMFYCVNYLMESVVWMSTLDGKNVVDLITLHNCTSLAANSFRRRLYIAESGQSHIMILDYEGERHIKILDEDPLVKEPHSLTIFEDHIYFLMGDSFKLVRCNLYGYDRSCKPFLYRPFEAKTFLIQHESMQRADIKNVCEGKNCSNVCVMAEHGPQCLCEDGSVPKYNGTCAIATIQLARFQYYGTSVLSDLNWSRLAVLYYTISGICIGLIIFYCFCKRYTERRRYGTISVDDTKVGADRQPPLLPSPPPPPSQPPQSSPSPSPTALLPLSALSTSPPLPPESSPPELSPLSLSLPPSLTPLTPLELQSSLLSSPPRPLLRPPSPRSRQSLPSPPLPPSSSQSLTSLPSSSQQSPPQLSSPSPPPSALQTSPSTSSQPLLLPKPLSPMPLAPLLPLTPPSSPPPPSPQPRLQLPSPPSSPSSSQLLSSPPPPSPPPSSPQLSSPQTPPPLLSALLPPSPSMPRPSPPSLQPSSSQPPLPQLPSPWPPSSFPMPLLSTLPFPWLRLSPQPPSPQSQSPEPTSSFPMPPLSPSPQPPSPLPLLSLLLQPSPSLLPQLRSPAFPSLQSTPTSSAPQSSSPLLSPLSPSLLLSSKSLSPMPWPWSQQLLPQVPPPSPSSLSPPLLLPSSSLLSPSKPRVSPPLQSPPLQSPPPPSPSLRSTSPPSPPLSSTPLRSPLLPSPPQSVWYRRRRAESEDNSVEDDVSLQLARPTRRESFLANIYNIFSRRRVQPAENQGENDFVRLNIPLEPLAPVNENEHERQPLEEN